MAIDDNTSYELTGAQVKDLASKINAKEDSADLAAVAESGSYNDLLDKPTIPAAQVNSDWNAASGVAKILNKPSLAKVATSGSYNDLSNKPTIGNATITIQKNGTSAGTFTTNATSNKSINITVPTATSDLTNDSGFITGIPTASTTTLGGIKVGDNLSVDASGVLSADDCPVYTANNVTPTADTTAAWKTALGGEGVYFTWYNATGKFTKQPSQYGFLMTVIGGNDVRQEWWTQTNGWHGVRTGNTSGWSSFSGSDGTFVSMGAKVDSSLSTSSTNPVQNKVVTDALGEKVNCKRSYATATTLNYKKITVVGGTYSTDGAGIILFTREERYIIDGMCASGYGGKCIELGTNHNASNTSATTSNRWVNVKVYGVPESRTTEIYCRMSPYTYVDVHSSGTITIADIDEAAWTAATNNSTYISLLDEGPGSYWGTCTTAAATAAKVVTVSAAQNFRLEVGAMVTFKAPNTNTAQNPTINVNSTGAKPIFFDNAVITTGNLNKAGQNGRPATYIYDGTNWVWVSWSRDDNTTYSTMSVSEGTTGTATTARTMRADYLKQIIEHYTPTATSQLTNDSGFITSADVPTVNDATLTIQRNGTNVQTFTANSSTNKTANIQVPNLQTSNTDPGEGAALAADTFLGVYDVAPAAIDGSRLTNSTVTGDKIDWSTMPSELVYSYTQKSDSSSEVVKDILIDWSKYKAVHVLISFEVVSGSGWVTQQLLSSTKAATSSRQRGWEASNSDFAGVHRTMTTGAIVACESTTGGQSWFDITLIKMGNSKSVGSNSTANGSETSQSVACTLWSSENTPPPYLRAHLLSPKAGAYIKVYGYR